MRFNTLTLKSYNALFNWIWRAAMLAAVRTGPVFSHTVRTGIRRAALPGNRPGLPPARLIPLPKLTHQEKTP
jgi:hypothetical protein